MRQKEITQENNLPIEKPTRKKKEDLSQYTLLQHIEKIVELTKDCKLEKAAIKKCRPYTKIMAERLLMSEMQCIFLSVFMDNSDDQNIEYRDFTRHFTCNNIRIYNYVADFDFLVQMGYIQKSTSHKRVTFTLPQDVVDTIVANKPYVKPPTRGLDAFGLFEWFDKYFEEREDEEISTKVLCEKIYNIMEENKELAFVKSVFKLTPLHSSNVYTPLLFVFMCHLLVNDDDDNVGFHDFEKIIDQKREFSKIKRQLKDGTFELLRKGLIELRKSEGLFSRDSYRLTKMVKEEVLREFDIDLEQSTAMEAKNTIKCESIVSKALFYNDNEQQQIEQLSSLLEDSSFKLVQERLCENGMRKGFAALFYGSPGTGKTESVYQIAKQTGRDIVEVNVSQIKSCWVGESEKNIKATFDNYRKLSQSSDRVPILLFNEADAVLGVRQEGAERAVDKMENSIQNIILQEMETLDGIMIATTNLTKNLDKAFERRFLYKIAFQKPSITAKQLIWQSMLPTLSDADATSLAERFDFSGGQIENIVRKQTIELILKGQAPTFEAIESYCKQEHIDKKEIARRVGF